MLGALTPGGSLPAVRRASVAGRQRCCGAAPQHLSRPEAGRQGPKRYPSSPRRHLRPPPLLQASARRPPASPTASLVPPCIECARSLRPAATRGVPTSCSQTSPCRAQQPPNPPQDRPTSGQANLRVPTCGGRGAGARGAAPEHALSAAVLARSRHRPDFGAHNADLRGRGASTWSETGRKLAPLHS